MNFVVSSIKIKSNWFEEEGKYSKFEHEAFYLYIQLHKFHVPNQDEYLFLTSIQQLRTITGYTKPTIIECLKRLVKYQVINCSMSRWDRVKDNDIIIVSAIDIPRTARTTRKTPMGKEEEYDKPDSDDDKWLSIDLKLMQHYTESGLDGREMGLHCLISKLSNNTEGKSWMSINKMADVLSLSNDKVNKMIRQMNRLYLLSTRYLKEGNQIVNGKKQVSFEHRIMKNWNDKYKDQWLQANKSTIDSNIKKWDKEKSGRDQIFDRV